MKHYGILFYRLQYFRQDLVETKTELKGQSILGLINRKKKEMET